MSYFSQILQAKKECDTSCVVKFQVEKVTYKLFITHAVKLDKNLSAIFRVQNTYTNVTTDFSDIYTALEYFSSQIEELAKLQAVIIKINTNVCV